MTARPTKVSNMLGCTCTGPHRHLCYIHHFDPCNREFDVLKTCIFAISDSPEGSARRRTTTIFGPKTITEVALGHCTHHCCEALASMRSTASWVRVEFAHHACHVLHSFLATEQYLTGQSSNITCQVVVKQCRRTPGVFPMILRRRCMITTCLCTCFPRLRRLRVIG